MNWSRNLLRLFRPAQSFHTRSQPRLFSVIQSKQTSTTSAMADAESERSPGALHPQSATMEQSSPTSMETEKAMPKLSAAEFREYNRMAEHMDYFHNHFRSTWNLLMTACESQKRPKGMSIRQFLATGEQFVQQLTMHHGIEERHIFPVLAKKMPSFRKELELLTQHKEIHKGMDKLGDYLGACRCGEKELRMSELKDVLDSFGEVLWQHLDDEVKELGAENMRKYWTVEEMRRMPM